MKLDDWLSAQLSELEQKDLLRLPNIVDDRAPGRVQIGGQWYLDFASNDYLGFATQQSTIELSGASASRLITGNHRELDDFEHQLADFLNQESALVFSTGFAANVGVIPALAKHGDLVLSDELNHASIIDGCRLSRATVQKFRHNDLEHLAWLLRNKPRNTRSWVITESVFSMDGDGPDLQALRTLTNTHGAFLYLDEAHAIGVLGAHGRGRAAECEIDADVLVGAFGKAFGAAGGFVAGSKKLSAYLYNSARSFVFSTGIPIGYATWLQNRLAQVRAADAERKLVLNHARTLSTDAAKTLGAIVTRHLPEPKDALTIQSQLRSHGLWVSAIRPPTIPHGGRLRIVPTAAHETADISRLAELMARLVAEQTKKTSP